MTFSFSLIGLSLLGCYAAGAQVLPNTIRISSETAPPGGMAQMKVLMTSPKPIMSGGMYMSLSRVSFSSINGIALFNGTGDVVGAAVVNGSSVNMRFSSPNGTYGATTDYPLMTVALRLSPTVQNGQVFPVYFDPSSFWQDLTGSTIPVELQPGSITVGGTASITNVLPGGGPIAGGGSFIIEGMGFVPQTKVQLNGLNQQSMQYLSPTQLKVTVRDAGIMDGLKITVQNPDKSSDTYYSYLRGVPVGQSARPLLAQTVPAFSLNTVYEALAPSTISPLVNADYFTAIALQNPGTLSATVTVESHDGSGALTGSTQVVLPSGSRISREVSELLGAVLPTGSYLRVVSAQPVQMLGLLGNDATGVVLPIAPVVISAPAPVSLPTAGPSGGGGGGGGGKGN